MDGRLDKIENSLQDLTVKMDKMAELMGAVIRMEEKHVSVQYRLDNTDSRLNKHSQTLDKLAIQLAKVSKSSGTNEWFIRLLIVAIVSSIAVILRNG
jgi:t-SNARE complex subunit (syntaxin)